MGLSTSPVASQRLNPSCGMGLGGKNTLLEHPSWVWGCPDPHGQDWDVSWVENALSYQLLVLFGMSMP